MKKGSQPTVSLVLLLATVFVFVFGLRHSKKVFAQSSGFVAQESIQTTSGGMAQYGTAEQTSASSSADLQAATNWSNYVAARSGWGLSSSNLSRLSAADWNARQSGAPTITAQQLAIAATQVINNALSTMTASQQEAMIQENTVLSASYGNYSFSKPDSSYISATQNSDGTWAVTISAAAFSSRKSFFQTYAPSMVSSYSNFYPDEAMLVTYSLATGDFGYSNNYAAMTSQMIAQLTGANMSGQLLFGDNGYLVRRPVSTFLTQSNIGQFFSDLGF